MKTTNSTKNAFTLVELMVVLAIIAGLMIMVIPNIRKQRARARSSQCQNNLRQYGVAMNQYMSEWNGYFIYAGGAFSAARTAADDFDMTRYSSARPTAQGGIRGSIAHGIDDFIPAYIPEPNITNIQFLRSGQSSVRICPEVNRAAFDPGPPDVPNPQFKGYRDAFDPVFEEMRPYADFEHRDGYTPEGELRLVSWFSTYGINRLSSVYQRARNEIPDRVPAFIDWNAEEGWGAVITNTTWMFRSPDGSIVQDSPKWTDEWWLTEIGFYHPGADGMVANYVAMDGSVSSISSNQISLDFFREDSL